MVNAKCDRLEILRGLRVYHAPGDTFEIRIQDAGKEKTVSGYFTEFEKAADEIVTWAKKGSAIYVTINPVAPWLIARSNSTLEANATNPTADKHIARLNWLPIDSDPFRPAGIPAEDDEHTMSIRTIQDIRQWLIESQGWPAAAFATIDSGNSGYLLCRIELENKQENSALVKKCLDALDYLFSNDFFYVDTTSSNPSRVFRVPGTMNAKGDEVGEMRTRMARVLEKTPETFEVVPRELLEILAAMLPDPETLLKHCRENLGVRFNPVVYCQVYNLQVHHTEPCEGAVLVILEECVFNPNHKLSAYIIGWPCGVMTYHCVHKSCIDKNWFDARPLIEADYVTPSRGAPVEVRQQTNLRSRQEQTIAVPPAGIPCLEDITKATGRIIRVNPITGEKEPDPEMGETTIPELTFSPSKAATAITGFLPLCISTSYASEKTESRKLWAYNGKIWIPDGEKRVKHLLDAIGKNLSYERGLQETIRRIKENAEVVIFDSNPYLFPALDKIVDLQTGQARDYLPEDHITFQGGAAWDNPDADHGIFLWLLCSTLPDPRDVLTALDIATAACIRIPFEAIIQLIGPGGGGKGAFEDAVTALCSPARVSTISPTDVIGKDLWVLSEVEDMRLAINILKKVSTGEQSDSDTKSGGRVQGKPHVLPILDCNNAVDFEDDSGGKIRCVIKLDYPYKFGYTPDTRRKDQDMKTKVTSPAVLSGILHLLADRAPFLCKTKRIYTRKKPEEIDKEYQRQLHSQDHFCEDCLTTEMPTDKNGQAINVVTGELYPMGQPPRLTTTKLLEEYKEYCTLFNVPTPSKQMGGYIHDKYGIKSKGSTSRTNGIRDDYRYYPNLWLAKTARVAYAELKLEVSSVGDDNPFSRRQDVVTSVVKPESLSHNTILPLHTPSTTVTTVNNGEWDSNVVNEINAMYMYISAMEKLGDLQGICYENYRRYREDVKNEKSCRHVVNGSQDSEKSDDNKKDIVVNESNDADNGKIVKKRRVVFVATRSERSALESACRHDENSDEIAGHH